MTEENKAKIQRATGIVEGIALFADREFSNALYAAVIILREVLGEKENNNG